MISTGNSENKGVAPENVVLELPEYYEEVSKIMKHIKDYEDKLNPDISLAFNNVNSGEIDKFYNSLTEFMTELNKTNKISEQLNKIFNASNDAEINKLNNDISLAFNNVNSGEIDKFYNSLTEFMTELNNTNKISEQLDKIFNAEINELNNAISLAFNNVNSGKIDNFYQSLTTFMTELNNTNKISEQLDKIFNASNIEKLNKLNQEIIKAFNDDMQKTTKWLEYYFAMEIELKRAMKPDPMIAYRLGKVATFLPNIGIGDIKDKMGEGIGNMMKGISSIKDKMSPNLSLSDMLPPDDYSNYEFGVGLIDEYNVNLTDENQKYNYHKLSDGISA
jgi:hypothetical protein